MRAARCVLSEVLQNSKKSSFRWTNATLRVYLVFCFSNDALNSKGNGKGYTIIPPIFISFRIQSLFEEDFLKQFHQLWIPNKIHFIGICEGFWFHSLCHYDDVLLTIFQKISFILVFRFHQILLTDFLPERISSLFKNWIRVIVSFFHFSWRNLLTVGSHPPKNVACLQHYP